MENFWGILHQTILAITEFPGEFKLFNWFYFLLSHLGNYTNFYHYTVSLVLYFYSDNGVPGTWDQNISYFRCK